MSILIRLHLIATSQGPEERSSNRRFSLRKTTDIICCKLALLALPIFLPQVKLLWALRISEIDLH